METTLLSWASIVFAVLMLAVPGYLLWRIGSLKTLRSTLLSVVRLVVQLLLVGIYMKWLFAYDSIWLNLVWVLLISLVGTFSICRAGKLRMRQLLLPVSCGLFVSSVVMAFYVLLLVVHPLGPALGTNYWVPVSGLLLGCVQRVSGVALGEYYHGLRHDGQLYEYLLGNGATHLEAVMPFVRRALEKALHPLLANMSVLGVTLLPGVLYGQLFGGASPMDAALFLIVLTIASFSASVISVVLSLYLADSRSFDYYGRLRPMHDMD